MKPNIIHIITHDTGKHLECYGADVHTPHINRLAKEGVKFTNYFCAAPQCSPSRASMFSGMMPVSHGLIGLTHRGFSLRPGIPYLPKILSQKGYHTYLFGLQHEYEPCKKPFHELRGMHPCVKNLRVLGYQKVFLGKSFSCKDVVPLFKNVLPEMVSMPFFISMGFTETHARFPDVKRYPPKLRVPEFLPEKSEVKRDIAGLNILVERVDDAVGEVLGAVRKAGLEDDTLVIFTTDHGIAMPGAKGTLFDPGIEICLVMKGPGFEGGKEVNALLSNVDFMPSILNYLGIDIPPKVDGVSFMPVIRGIKKEVRKEIYAESTFHTSYDPVRAIRTRKYKYIRSFEIRPLVLPKNVDQTHTLSLFLKQKYFNTIRPVQMLFDLEKDHLERKNLIGDKKYSPVAQKLDQTLTAWMEKHDDPVLSGAVVPPQGVRVDHPIWKNCG